MINCQYTAAIDNVLKLTAFAKNQLEAYVNIDRFFYHSLFVRENQSR